MDEAALQERLGYEFSRGKLLRQALTHRSYGQPNNERLEFLGDSVLNCAIATLLFERFPADDEGDLSRLRAFLVKQQALYNVAQRISLGQSLLLGEGESRSGGTRRPSILADALEAVIGAVFVDSGFDQAKALINRLYEVELSSADPSTLGKDAKTRLQEELQRSRMPLPVYQVAATHGAAHKQVFDVECVVSRFDIRVVGSGASRRAAEQMAADKALKEIAKLESKQAGSGRKSARKPANRNKVSTPAVNDSAAKPRKRRIAKSAPDKSA